MGETVILTVEGSVATGGGVLDLGIAPNSILHSVSIFPIGVTTETTTVSSLLYANDELVSQIVARDTASSGATYPQGSVTYPHLPLVDDRSYTLKTVILNASGAAVIWRVVAMLELMRE